jgi:hypothetical protein
LEFGSEFLATELKFTEGNDFRLVGIEEPLTLPFEALSALHYLGLLGSERGKILLFALRPCLVELR